MYTSVSLFSYIYNKCHLIQFLSPPFLSRRGHERCVDPLPRFYDFMIFLEYSVHEHRMQGTTPKERCKIFI